jgi:hypothetical protein
MQMFRGYVLLTYIWHLLLEIVYECIYVLCQSTPGHFFRLFLFIGLDCFYFTQEIQISLSIYIPTSGENLQYNTNNKNNNFIIIVIVHTLLRYANNNLADSQTYTWYWVTTERSDTEFSSQHQEVMSGGVDA